MSKSLLIDLYELTMAQVYFKQKRKTLATFDLFIRSPKRPFYVACGIDDALQYLDLEELKFTKEDIDYLKNLALFEDDFLDYLKEFKFQGDIWTVEEPEIVFFQEPILRVSGSLIETQIVESVLLNKINLGTTLATKSARVILTSKGRSVYDFSLRRTQGIDASLAAAKCSYITGAKGTSNVLAGFLYKIPVVGTMAHSFIMSFDKETDSFLAFASQFPTRSILLVDTYDVKKGIDSAIRVARFLKRRGFDLLGIRLDSGNLVEDAKYARKILDENGLIDTLIFASGNLDEYKIKKMVKENAPIDAFGVGTNMGCSSDNPYTDVIYKLVEIKERGKNFIPTMKLSEGKVTLPARKQVFRIFDKNGTMEKDIIGLEKEKINGKKLLKKLMDKGKRISKEKSCQEKQEIFLKKIKTLPPSLKEIDTNYQYPILISNELASLAERVKKQIKKRFSPKVIFMDIDTQYDFLNKKGALYVKDSEDIIPNLKKMINFAKRNKILVISSQDTHRKDDPEFEQFIPHCIKKSWGHKKLKETLLKKHKILTFRKIYSKKDLEFFIQNYEQIILEKNVLNLFANPNTVNLLETIFPEQIVIFGVVTEYCVKEAIEGLIKMGFSVVVVEDAIKEVSSQEKEKHFSLWKRKGIEFKNTKDIIQATLLYC